MNLSNKIFERKNLIDKDLLKVKDVREAVKELKDNLINYPNDNDTLLMIDNTLLMIDMIDQIFGEKLI